MRKRSDEFGVAEVHWVDLSHADGSHTGIASGDSHMHHFSSLLHAWLAILALAANEGHSDIDRINSQ